MLKPASLDSWGEENSPTQAERRPFTLSYSHLTNFDSRTPTANALTTDADFFQFNHKCVRTKNPEFYHRTYVFTVTPQVTQLLHSVKKSNLLAYFLWKKKKVLLSTLFHLVFFSVLILWVVNGRSVTLLGKKDLHFYPNSSLKYTGTQVFKGMNKTKLKWLSLICHFLSKSIL